jgi:hypothetical protein
MKNKSQQVIEILKEIQPEKKEIEKNPTTIIEKVLSNESKKKKAPRICRHWTRSEKEMFKRDCIAIGYEKLKSRADWTPEIVDFFNKRYNRNKQDDSWAKAYNEVWRDELVLRSKQKNIDVDPVEFPEDDSVLKALQAIDQKLQKLVDYISN